MAAKKPMKSGMHKMPGGKMMPDAAMKKEMGKKMPMKKGK